MVKVALAFLSVNTFLFEEDDEPAFEPSEVLPAEPVEEPAAEPEEPAELLPVCEPSVFPELSVLPLLFSASDAADHFCS